MTLVARTLNGRTIESIILSGHGDFLIEDALEKSQWKTSTYQTFRKAGPDHVACAPAHAVAVLAQEAFSKDPSVANAKVHRCVLSLEEVYLTKKTGQLDCVVG